MLNPVLLSKSYDGIGQMITKNMWNWTQQFLSIIITAIAILIICIIYNVKIRGHKEGERMSGFLVLIEMMITSVEDMVVNAMGKRYRKLTPYALYIILYIFIGSIFSLLGIESLATSYTVPLAMGLVTFFCVYYFGFKYQKLGYFKRYKNPIEIFTQFTPIVSISFRLFGNLLGGSIIMGLVYALFIGLQTTFAGGEDMVDRIYNTRVWDYNPTNGAENIGTWEDNWQYQFIYFWAGFNVFTTFITPWLHMYFDLFDAGVQSIVFAMLTLSYWQEAMGEGNEGKEPQKRGAELQNDRTISVKDKNSKTVQVTV